MTEVIVPGSKTFDTELMELGLALGQSHTFGLVAGRCSAAQAQAIRRLREEKLFKKCCDKWDDFCSNFLNMCRAEADRIIRLLEEFGPAYFEVSQAIRISAGTFRAIAPAVSDGVLHYKGETIPINGENARKVAAAVTELRNALPKKSAERSAPADDLKHRIDSLAERCFALIDEVDRSACYERLGPTRMHLRDELVSLRDQILRVAA
jgi:hypothetical protein